MEMAKELKLSDEQMAKVEALQKAKRESALAEREKFQTEFQKILNSEQKAKYNELISAYGNGNGKGFCPQGEMPEMGK
jgi:flagellar motility protein MotE (MotC chaperone)